MRTVEAPATARDAEVTIGLFGRLAMFRMHLALLAVCVLIVAASLSVCWLKALRLQGLGTETLLLAVFTAVFMPIPIYMHASGRYVLRDTMMTIPWCLVLTLINPLPYVAGERLGLLLRDETFMRMDAGMGVDVAAIAHWASRHAMGILINRGYDLLGYYLLAAVLLPPILKKKESWNFLLANLAALLIGSVCTILVPAVGPWVSEHFIPNAQQVLCQREVYALRVPQPAFFTVERDPAAIVCFPSFHVIWAILCASAFWGFRRVRVILVLLSALIILSTLTTGWHYFVDVLGGLAVAVIALVTSREIMRRAAPSPS